MELILITSKNGKPSKRWVIDENLGRQIGVLGFLFEDAIHEQEMIHLNIDDDTFKWVYDLLHVHIDDYCNVLINMDLDLLFNIYKVCDYLNISRLQELVSVRIAAQLNKMDSRTLKTTVDSLLLAS